MNAFLSMPTLRLKRGRTCRAAEGHPWVFAGEVEAPPDPKWNGQAAVCRDTRGRLLGSGIVNTRSQIVWRQFSLRAEAFDDAAVVTRLDEALRLRAGATVARLVWSESDRLPGLTVDRFGEVLVGQALTWAVDQRRELIAAHLLKVTGCKQLIWRDDAPMRVKEGLEVREPTPQIDAFWLDLDGVSFLIDPAGGQKTGFYLDQREQHRYVATLARGRRVLDCFCHQGGFAIHALKAGAASAVAVDASAEAVEAGRRAAERNGVVVEFIQANAFDYLKTMPQGAFDLIVLDPPPFAPGRDRLEGALRGYKEINLRALKSLNPGGILATYTCSHHVNYDLFRSVLSDAAHDAGRRLRLLETAVQPWDHPVVLHFPESEYLRGFIVEVTD